MPLRVIQVGVGGFGSGWTHIIHADENVEAVGMVDINSVVLRQRAKELNMDESCCFADLDEALNELDADAVVNITPPPVHKEVALKAFGAGLHVLTEKPLADTMENGKEMVAAAERHGKILMVSQNYRYRRWARTIKQIISNGEIGEIDNCSVFFAKAPKFEGSYRLKMEYPLLIDMSIHHFDLMRSILGVEPVRIYAKSSNPSWSWFDHDASCVVLFEMGKGVNVIYNASWVTRGKETSWDGDWRIECSGGIVELRGNKVFTCADAKNDIERELVDMPAENQSYSLMEFRNSIESGTEPETSGRDNLKSFAMIFATLDSIKSGAPTLIKDYL